MANVHQFVFHSVSALVAAAEQPCTDARSVDRCRRNDADRDESWLGIGVRDGAHARQLAREGQPSLTARVANMAMRMPEALQDNPRRTRVRGELGDAFDLDRVMMGVSECWDRMTKEARPTLPRIIVAVDSWMTWSESAETLAWRGAAVAKAAETASLAGFQVTVVNAFSARDWFERDNKPVVCITVVSTPDAPLDPTTMATAVAMPAMTRAVIWNALVRTGINKLGKHSTDHMGSQRDISVDEIRNALGEYDALMILANRRVHDESTAAEWLAGFAETLEAAARGDDAEPDL